MSADRDDITAFLTSTEREDALAAVLAVDQQHDTWTFDDIPVDSGTFGELVGRGIVTKHDGAYRLADPALVETALTADSTEPTTTRTATPNLSLSRYALQVPHPRILLGITLAFTALFTLRIPAYSSVFRDGNIILPANDPYHFRYWVDQLALETTGPFDPTIFDVNPGRGYPLTYQTGWWLAELIGGDLDAVATVSAWSPVLAALLTGTFVYLFALTLTDDHRFGIASVLMFAFIPVHSVYSGLGFFDHHAFDYVVLALTGTALAWLARDLATRTKQAATNPVIAHLQSPTTWFVSIVLAIAVATQILLWSGAPLLLGAFAGYLALRSLMDRHHVSPLLANLPVLTALLLAGLITHLPPTRFGWHHPVVAYAPLLVLAGGIGVLLLAELGHRLPALPTTLLAIADLSLVYLGARLLRHYRPEYWDQLRSRADDLFFRVDIAEVAPLFTTEFAIMFGPLYQFGLVFYLGLAALLWASWRCYRSYHPAWLVVIVYTWYHIVLAGIQVRFAGELSPFIAVLAGVALVYGLTTVDLTPRPDLFAPPDTPSNTDAYDTDSLLPSRQRTTYLVAAILFVGIFSFIMIPSFAGVVNVTDDEYEAAMWISDDVEERDIDHRYPVVSEWDETRFYNYWARGVGDRQGHPSIGRNYADFTATTDPDEYYSDMAGSAEYVVLTSRFSEGAPPDVTQTILHEDYGTATGDFPGTAHYQLAFIPPDESVTVFRLVPGATIHAPTFTSPNETITLATHITVNHAEFTYEKRTTTNHDGNLSVTLAHPGDYTLGNTTITIPPHAVETGDSIHLPANETT